MCDYSLESQMSRPAQVGDKLVTSGFQNTTTRGFTAVGTPDVAICLVPGTELGFEKNIEAQGGTGLSWATVREEPFATAIFRQINTDISNEHHDALELPNGQYLLLTRLREGQYATVLQLPVKIQGENAKPARAGQKGIQHQLGVSSHA